jgi:hypothetical protein
MSWTYRKQGAAARITVLRGEVFETTTRESGVAGSSGGRFFSASAEAAVALPGTALDDARSIRERVVAAIAGEVTLERLRVVCGASTHTYAADPKSERTWMETLTVVHLTLLAPSGARVSVLRGGAAPSAIEPAAIAMIARALAGARRRQVASGTSVVLSPAVAAALAVDLARGPRIRREARVVQHPHPDFPVDGEGRTIAAFDAAGTAITDWPNVFRPSYRSPAVPALMHAGIETSGTVASRDGCIEAIELLRPPHASSAAIAIDALCESGGETFVASLEIPVAELSKARAVDGERFWFPFHAGAWGRPVAVATA